MAQIFVNQKYQDRRDGGRGDHGGTASVPCIHEYLRLRGDSERETDRLRFLLRGGCQRGVADAGSR